MVTADVCVENVVLGGLMLLVRRSDALGLADPGPPFVLRGFVDEAVAKVVVGSGMKGS